MPLITYNNDCKNYNSLMDIADIKYISENIPLDFCKFNKMSNMQKEQLLITASKRLCHVYRFKGYRLKSSQSLCFPRTYSNPCPTMCRDEIGLIPDDIKTAVLILAYDINNQLSGAKDKESGDLKREKIGRTLEIEYYENNPKSNSLPSVNVEYLVELAISEYVSLEMTTCRA